MRSRSRTCVFFALDEASFVRSDAEYAVNDTELFRASLPALVPATVQWAIRSSEHPFVPGLSPLLGIDTWLEASPPARPVVLDRTRLGRGDLLHNPVALDPEHAVPIDATVLDAP